MPPETWNVAGQYQAATGDDGALGGERREKWRGARGRHTQAFAVLKPSCVVCQSKLRSRWLAGRGMTKHGGRTLSSAPNWGAMSTSMAVWASQGIEGYLVSLRSAHRSRRGRYSVLVERGGRGRGGLGCRAARKGGAQWLTGRRGWRGGNCAVNLESYDCSALLQDGRRMEWRRGSAGIAASGFGSRAYHVQQCRAQVLLRMRMPVAA
jgi:hypothetical protein